MTFSQKDTFATEYREASEQVAHFTATADVTEGLPSGQNVLQAGFSNCVCPHKGNVGIFDTHFPELASHSEIFFS